MKRKSENKDWPYVSVLIASKDRRSDLKQVLESLNQLDYPKNRMEIVVVEETETPMVLKGVQYYTIPRKNLGFGYARNQCVLRAKHSLLAFTDDDCLVEPNWLKELISGLKTGAGGVAGAVHVKKRQGIGFCESILGFPGGGLKISWRAQNKIVPTSQLSTCNALFKKEVFEKIGLFQENTLFSGEDYDFAQRVIRQFPCYYNPKAIIYHRPRGTFKEIFKWFIRRGRCEVNMLLLKTHSLKWQLFYIFYTSFSLRLLLVVLALLSLNISAWIAIVLYLIAYTGLNLYRTFFQFKVGGSLKTWFLTPVVKLVMDLGWDVGKVAGFLRLFSKKENQNGN